MIHPGDHPRPLASELALLAAPAIVVVTTLPGVAAAFVPPLGAPLERFGRYLLVAAALVMVNRTRPASIRLSLPAVAWVVASLLAVSLGRAPDGWTPTGALAVLAVYLGPWLMASADLGAETASRLLAVIAWLPTGLVGLGLVADRAGLAPLIEVDAASGSPRLGGLMIAAAWAALGVGAAHASGMRIALGHRSGWIPLVVSGLLIIGAQGRGAGLALAAGSAPLVGLALRRHPGWSDGRHALRALALLAAAGAVAVAGYRVVLDRQRVTPIPLYLSDVVVESDPTSGRFRAWAYYLERWLDQPLFGHGPSSVYALSQSSGDRLIATYFGAAHNEYVQALVEVGAVGLVLVAGALVAEALLARRRTIPELRPFPLALLASYATFALTDNATSPTFAGSIALLIAVCRHTTPAGGPAGGPAPSPAARPAQVPGGALP